MSHSRNHHHHGSSQKPPPPSEASIWLFSDKEIRETPSRLCGVSEETELRLLARTSGFLQECARELLLPQLTVSVALKFFQRFFMLESMTRHRPPHVAGACLFLACKVQETHKRLKDLIYWTVKVRTRNTADYPDGQDVHEDSPGYYEEKRAILDKEREVLRVLNFDLSIDHPYKHLWTLNQTFLRPANKLEQGDRASQEDEHRRKREEEARRELRKQITQSAWNFINDSFRTYMHVRYAPHEIASAALVLAAKLHSFALPTGKEINPLSGRRLLPVHEYFGMKEGLVDEIVERILDLYEADGADSPVRDATPAP